jgi:hypothetical protein
MLLTAAFCGGIAFAAIPILGTWKLNVAKSRFGHVRRVVSADFRTLTVHNPGTQLSAAKRDETLVLDKQ